MKNCMNCKHFKWEDACPGESEFTPGYHFKMKCDLGKWKMGGESDYGEDDKPTEPTPITPEEYFNTLKQAQTCIGFLEQE